MARGVNAYRRRIEALVRVWSEISLRKTRSLSRDELAEILKKIYSEERVEPIRGRSIPEDIYYKELAALYYVGLHGLGIGEEFPSIFQDALSWEARVEETFKRVVETNDPSVLKETFGDDVDENTLVKILRVPLTGVLLGFEKEEDFRRFLHAVKRAYPKLEDVVRNYARFYVALRTAEGIASGRIKNKTSKEAFKRALTISMGFEKNIPSDSYIYSIAREVFKVKKRKLSSLLTPPKKE